ncbi:MAG: MBL fold metallo-hydrolase [Desulfobacterota bacterium]|jgi:ribonuclease BN (tRNA processing enzyme)|nr:MBL fold metallo-hydrolase [Thermodesulfobacteriota bacterium]
MKITFLGTNGWYDTSTGNTLSILVATEEHNIVLDAGNGFTKLDRMLSNANPLFLFLSHFHLDHLIGLHSLFKFSFTQRFAFVGPKGTGKVLKALLKQPFTAPLEHLSYKTEILEMPTDEGRLPFTVKGFDLVHPPLSMGYRFLLEGKTIAYCPDTGYCANAVTLAKDADLLISECSFLPGEQSADWPHLNPQIAARIAKEAGARRLALVHFDAAKYTTLELRKDAEREARKIFADAVACEDDEVVEL